MRVRTSASMSAGAARRPGRHRSCARRSPGDAPGSGRSGGKAPDGHRAGHDARRAGSGGTGVVDRVVFPARSGARPPAAGERRGDRGSRAFGAELEDDGVGAVCGEERANVSRRVRGEHVRDADEVNDGPAGAILEGGQPASPRTWTAPGLQHC